MGCGCGKSATPPPEEQKIISSTLDVKATSSLEDEIVEELNKKDPEKSLAMSMLNKPLSGGMGPPN